MQDCVDILLEVCMMYVYNQGVMKMAKTSLVDVDFAELELRVTTNYLNKAPMKGSIVDILMAEVNTGRSTFYNCPQFHRFLGENQSTQRNKK